MLTHFLPMRQLITTPADHTGTLDDAETRIWGPWLIQGYAWIVGFLYFSTAGAVVSTFTVHQGYEDRALLPAPPVPPWCQWLHTNTFNVAPALTTLVPFKINVLGEALYFSLLNNSGEEATYWFTAYLRND